MVLGMQVALILPCMRLGEAVLGAEKLPVTGVGFRDLWDHPAKVFPVIGHAMMGFVILLPFFIIGLTLALRPIFVWCKRRCSEIQLLAYFVRCDDGAVRISWSIVHASLCTRSRQCRCSCFFTACSAESSTLASPLLNSNLFTASKSPCRAICCSLTPSATPLGLMQAATANQRLFLVRSVNHHDHVN